MPIEKLRHSFSFDEERIKGLKRIAPEAFEHCKINWEVLKEALGEHLEDETGEVEHFGLFWPGKKEARRIASIPSKGTLVPVYGEGLKAVGTPDTDGVNESNNIFIEGENLEVLKILQKSYGGRIKMIYIDPPYNTGNDFVYDDNFTEPLEEYLRRTGQIDGVGKPLTTNKRADGRFHSKWLSMMFPRLLLARNLLKEEGVLFISIDENEIHNLRALVLEVFGEENYISTIIWQKKYSPQNDSKYFSDSHEYILCCAKNKESFEIGLLPRTEEANARYKNPDSDPRGPWKSSDLTRQEFRPNDYYAITSPKTGKEFYPPKGNSWGRPQEKIEELITDNRIWFGPDGNSVPSLKRFLSEVKDGITPQTLWFREDVGDSQEGKKRVKEIYGDVSVFETPKPVRLIKQCLLIANPREGDIVLDFFSGSGTTAESVNEFSNLSKQKLSFIMVQIPELLDIDHQAYKAGFKTIVDISKYRLKKCKIDYGFYKLKQSSFKIWISDKQCKSSELEGLFSEFLSPLVDGYSKTEILSEIKLLQGFWLTDPIVRCRDFHRNEVHKISNHYFTQSLFISLDSKIEKETIANLFLSENDIFICLDTAISDQDKILLSDKGLIKTI